MKSTEQSIWNSKQLKTAKQLSYVGPLAYNRISSHLLLYNKQTPSMKTLYLLNNDQFRRTTCKITFFSTNSPLHKMGKTKKIKLFTQTPSKSKTTLHQAIQSGKYHSFQSMIKNKIRMRKFITLSCKMMSWIWNLKKIIDA